MRKIFLYTAAMLYELNVFSRKSFEINKKSDIPSDYKSKDNKLCVSICCATIMKLDKCRPLLFILIASFLTLIVNAQKNHFLREVFYSDSTALFLENHYIRNANNVTYQPYDIKMPYPDFYFDIYGSRLQISAYNLHELMKNGGVASTGSYRDTVKQDTALFNLHRLEYAVAKNGTTETNWTPATSKPYTDTFVNNYNNKNKTYYRQGYLFYDDSLSNGDSLTISFRKESSKPFLNIHFKKLSALESPPFLMGSIDKHDKDFPLEKFVQMALESYQSLDKDFYEDWPGQSDNSNVKLFPETKTAYYFRPRTDVPNDSLFQYRLIVGGNELTEWKKSDNIIFVSGLEAGRQYQLEVRYADKPQYVFKKGFYVPGYWYQNIWFKTGIAFLLLLMGLVLFFFFKNKKQKIKQAEQKGRMKTLHSQLNPHFIFNALGSIQGLLNNGQLENANRYLSGFGSVLRSALDSSEKDTIMLNEELQNLTAYIHLEQLRRPFHYTQHIDEEINPMNIEMLPMFFQPIIENAIKHGYGDNHALLNICLSVKKEGNNLNVNIQDNGTGFNTAELHTGKGLRLIKERIDLFNRISRNKKIIQELSSSDNGTFVCIKFINWFDND